MKEEQASPDEDTRFIPDIQEVATDAPMQWINKGWEDMKACPVASLFYGVCFVVGGYLMIFSLRDAPEYIAAVIMGFVIMGPFLALGLYELSAQRERGEQCRLLPTLMACRKNVGNMAAFALMLLAVFLVWAYVSVAVFALFYPGDLPTMGEFLKHVILTEQLDFLLAYFGIGFIFVLIIFGISLISIPLIKDKQMGAVSAAIASTRALALNPVPMIVWSGLITALSLLGFATLLLGTLVAGPLLGHATWHAYRGLTGTTVSGNN
jgi:uncharacterized membrane protein